jgi:hypothetical protein
MWAVWHRPAIVLAAHHSKALLSFALFAPTPAVLVIRIFTHISA